MRRNVALTPVLVTTFSAQTDVWVDPAAGLNAATGQRPGEAWRTLGHASASTGGIVTVHLMPSTYGSSSGEIYTLTVPHQTSLISTEGVDRTTLPATGTSAQGVLVLEGDTRIEGLELELNPVSNSAVGFLVSGFSSSTVATLHGVRVAGGGIAVSNNGGDAHLESCELIDQRWQGVTWSETGDLAITDSRIVGWVGDGLGVFLHYIVPTLDVSVLRTSIEQCGLNGIRVGALDQTAVIDVTVSDSVVTDNGAHGIHTPDTFASSSADIRVGATISPQFGRVLVDPGKARRRRMVAPFEGCATQPGAARAVQTGELLLRRP